MKTITPEDLRNARCEECGQSETHDCQDLTLSGRCHPQAGVQALYQKKTHTLRLRCARCNTHVVDIQLPPPDDEAAAPAPG